MFENNSTSDRHSVTFRLDQSVLNKLKNIADGEKISLNTLVNQVFMNYVDWDAKAVKAGWMVFHKPALKEIIENIDDEDLVELAKNTSNYLKDVNLVMSGCNDLEGYLSLLRNRAKRSGFVLVDSKDEKNRRLILQHDLGRKGSIFFKAQCEQMLQNLGCHATFDFTANIVVIDLKN